jgi:hypothetical protein
MSITYRTTDLAKWGSGKGANLTASEADNNFWDLLERLVALETDPPEAVSISNIVVAQTTMMIYMTDGSTFGPFVLPVANWAWKGEWTAGVHYYQLDLVTVAGRGLYLVLNEHDAVAPFDPDATTPIDGFAEYQLVFGEDTYIYDFGMYYPGTPGFGIEVGKTLAAHMPGRDIWIDIDAPNSIAKLTVAPAADLVFALKKNTTAIGTLTFPAGETDGVFAIAARTQFNAGDIFRVIRPTALDVDAEELMVTVLAIRGIIPA